MKTGAELEEPKSLTETMLDHQKAVVQTAWHNEPPTMPLKADEWEVKTVWNDKTCEATHPTEDGWWLIAHRALITETDNEVRMVDVYVYARRKNSEAKP